MSDRTCLNSKKIVPIINVTKELPNEMQFLVYRFKELYRQGNIFYCKLKIDNLKKTFKKFHLQKYNLLKSVVILPGT